MAYDYEHLGVLRSDAAKQQIAAKYADPNFMKAYCDERTRGHAAAVAEMARLYLQAYPPDDGPWPALTWCIAHVAQTLDISKGRAGAMVCQACAERLIRWSHGFLTPSAADWQAGHIDARGDLVTERSRYDLLHLSGSDLADWLRGLSAKEPWHEKGWYTGELEAFIAGQKSLLGRSEDNLARQFRNQHPHREHLPELRTIATQVPPILERVRKKRLEARQQKDAATAGNSS